MVDVNSYRRREKLLEPTWLMPALDIAIAFLSFIVAYVARYDWELIRPLGDPSFRLGFEPYIPYAIIYIIWLLVTYSSVGLYRPVRGRPLMDEIYALLNGVTNASVLLMAMSFILQPLVFSRLMMIYAAIFSLLAMALVRVMRRVIYARLRSRGIGIQRTLVVGGGEVGLMVMRNMLGRKELGFQPVGYIADDVEQTDIGRLKALGTLDKLKQVLRSERVDVVVITLPWAQRDLIMQLLKVCRKANVEVNLVPDVFELNLRQVQIDQLEGIPLLRVTGDIPFKTSNRLVKRIIDLLLTIISAPVWLVLFALTAMAIQIEGVGPVFYGQMRVGENGKPFKIYKFRTMVPDADKLHAQLVKDSGQDMRHPKLKDDPRITPLGGFLRRTSLDELPQVWNVLRGDMSLVGPRPPTPGEVELYEPWHMQRLQVKPGMTGLWQVRGRSEVPFEEMCLLDIYYIENWSMQMDAQILMLTIPRVLLRQGAH
jgi:exopolysaccharide biosynthesis polyprenyl glycosylphosphotransferase